MTPSFLVRLSGLVFAASGLINVFADLFGNPVTAWLNFAGVMAGLMGFVGVYLVQFRISGLFGLVSATVAFLGLAGIAGFLFADAFVFPSLDPDIVAALKAGPTGLAIFASVAAYVVGTILFVASSFPGGVHPRPALVLWAIGVLPTVAAIALTPLVMTFAEVIAGCGVAWIGLSMVRRAEALLVQMPDAFGKR